MTGEVFDINKKIGFDHPLLNAKIEVVSKNFELISLKVGKIKWSVDFYIKVYRSRVGVENFLFHYTHESEPEKDDELGITTYETIEYVDTLHSIDVNRIKISKILFTGEDYYQAVCDTVESKTKEILRLLGNDDLYSVDLVTKPIDYIFYHE